MLFLFRVLVFVTSTARKFGAVGSYFNCLQSALFAKVVV